MSRRLERLIIPGDETNLTVKKIDVDYDARGLVFDVDRFALHDGPGIRMTIFLKGCPLQCAWCHSPESQNPKPEIAYYFEKCLGCQGCLASCPEEGVLSRRPGGKIRIDRKRCTLCWRCVEECYPGALKRVGRWMTVQELIGIGLRDRIFHDFSGGGVTLTGGEVTLQAPFAGHFLRAAGEQGIHRAVETSGFSPWPKLREVAEAADLILYDLKVMDGETHRKYIGVDNALIRENLRRLAGTFPEKEIHIRVPCIPNISDREENIRETALFMKEIGLYRLALLPFNGSVSAKYLWVDRVYALPSLRTQSRERLENLRALAASMGLEAEICG